MSLELTSRVTRLQDRALMLKKVRAFFEAREVMEVDVPILSHAGSVDTHIDLIEAKVCQQRCYLHSSPEYGMKRLLAEGVGDIYQLSHVFRNEEVGERHQPEFVMAEWYRMDYTLEEMIAETCAFIQLFLPDLPNTYERLPYAEAFDRYANEYPESLEERDYLFGFEVEPKLGQEGLTVLYKFPPEQAALAQVDEQGLAQRFEVFYRGVELANGYQELIDSKEQKHRLERANQERLALKKMPYPIDTHFLHALERGLPDCCGVAVGFDRLMMLRHEVQDIREVIPISWERA